MAARSISPRRAPRSLALLGALALLAAPLAAHDHWIAPSSFRPAVGERVDLRLCVGHPGALEEQPRDPRRFLRFERVGASGTRALAGLDGRSPAAFFTPGEAGALTLVYQSKHAFVQIEAERYHAFLREEGLEGVLAERVRAGESAQPGRDSYLRCDKALLAVGGVDARDRALGLPVELVLEDASGALVLRLELEGKPLSGQQVKLMRLAAPHTIELARTDGAGRARFAPASAGAYVASSLHQRRADPALALEGDWEGLWASLAFEWPGPTPRSPP